MFHDATPEFHNATFKFQDARLSFYNATLNLFISCKVAHFMRTCSFCARLLILCELVHFVQGCSFYVNMFIFCEVVHFMRTCPFCEVVHFMRTCSFHFMRGSHFNFQHAWTTWPWDGRPLDTHHRTSSQCPLSRWRLSDRHTISSSRRLKC